MSTDKITVLGKTFNNEEERREYFRNELRKHLPELKKMEGFPIGEDEDIIKLSDPPYYTACPNPWLNDFITEWEEEKKQLEKEGKRSADFVVDEPYASDVSEGKNNPIYMAHSYHTKVPHPAIMRYILHYTQPGDIVYDGFAGTGMTGVAANMCNNPEVTLKYQIENELGVKKWGKRNSIIGDLSPIATFISYNYNSKKDLVNQKSSALTILKEIEKEFGYLYETKHSDGKIGRIVRTIWSDIFICPNCNKEVDFWDNAVDLEKEVVSKEFPCPSCSISVTKRGLDRSFETVFDPILNKTITRKKEKPKLIYYTINNKTHKKVPDNDDLNAIEKANQLINKNYCPTQRIIKGEKTTEFIRNGYEYYHQLYYDRTLFVLSEFFKRSKSLSNIFYMTSILLRATKLFRWSKNQAGPMMGTFYIASATFEINPFNLFRNKTTLFDSLNITKDFQSIISTVSSTDNKINNNSIDYIFTDPPFGANLMYSELNSIWESWLKIFTNNEKEAIESKSQKKSLFDYQKLMEITFRQYYNVLKPNRWMTVEFSNTNASVWNTIQTSLINAGFLVANVSALDKKQGTFNAVSNPTSVKQDLVISCYKPSSDFDKKFEQHQYTDMGVWDFVEEHLNHLPIHLVKENSTTAIIERSPKILFDRLIAFYVQKGLPVPIDAGKFQHGLRERFVETDGMFFTTEQAAEYDKKKAEHPEFVQLSLLVASEQDGVLWLKNKLTEQPMTYQDIQPEWMRALSGLRKGDILPELKDLLEENFLKDEEGRWYQPDPENEIDLEKLRNKRLLKQFEIYRTEAAKPKTKKIKEVRVEALRTGFKYCYQEKDFKSIVEIGNKIPENLLMEDEVLLQFYDIASNKI